MWRDGERLAGAKFDNFLRIPKGNSNAALKDIESVLDVVVIVPGNALGR
jgi:hypothetical protein